jgi:hypothetical protein
MDLNIDMTQSKIFLDPLLGELKKFSLPLEIYFREEILDVLLDMVLASYSNASRLAHVHEIIHSCKKR